MSTRPVEDPVITKDEHRGTRVRHPAFAQITVSRINGQRNLYGSDFTHQSYLRVAITGSELNRDLSHDWPHPTGTIIEVDLSEAQWATFVSSPNVGGGVQCTQNFQKGVGLLPDLPVVDRREQFQSEVDDKLKNSLEQLHRTREEIVKMGLPKGKTADIVARLDTSIRELEANLPFVAKSFGQHMERTAEKAKMEIHGYVQHQITRAGLKALGADNSPLVLNDRDSNEDDDHEDGTDI